jgi:hypothetical protein
MGYPLSKTNQTKKVKKGFVSKVTNSKIMRLKANWKQNKEGPGKSNIPFQEFINYRG